MPIPAECPDCGSLQVSVSSQPPAEHEYNGWVTQIECAACGWEAYEPELTNQP